MVELSQENFAAYTIFNELKDIYKKEIVPVSEIIAFSELLKINPLEIYVKFRDLEETIKNG
jgi:hypothetical protein